ncbi:MAG: hypothetical protein A2902_06530 [Elusimicrobia bacterium RIFCSPLOWO2_01_FULL_64_13]|nr:MAG: hypothetical protein A2636_01610 [Elusimicrobia bacterium RIFCSPHIGHO2_01_FULL_64_10]OGR96685.1 MAG: hypothetical protein A2902_06530 [Elusimicrobia bacterium RIFCSPLOWO2_01_FULL_64_13]
MKVLFLTHTFPYPPTDGMRSTCYQLIKHVSRKHETALLSLIESDKELVHVPEIRKSCGKVETVRHDTLRDPLRRIRNVIFESMPFCVAQFQSEAFARKLSEMLREGRYDLVHFLSVNVAGYRSVLGGTPGLLFPHDAVSMQFSRTARREPNPLRKLYWMSQSAKMKFFEKTEMPLFAKTVVVSEVDRRWLAEFLPQISIPVIPGGVDPDHFKPGSWKEEFPSVLFRGVMNFVPNADAAVYFCKKILPLIRAEFPGLRVMICGKDPTLAVRALHDGRNVFVTGLVPDLRPYMGKASVHICPMRSGSGMKNKILEAWAMEKPVVATSLAADGIDCEHGRNILIADTPLTFAQYVVQLLKDPELRARLGKNGREQALKKYTWTAVAAMFDEVYAGLVKKP